MLLAYHRTFLIVNVWLKKSDMLKPICAALRNSLKFGENRSKKRLEFFV